MKILVITAHPDDVDFGAGGTIARWISEGHEVVYCLVTDGDAGGFDPSVPRSAIAGIRQREQTAAAKEVIVKARDVLPTLTTGVFFRCRRSGRMNVSGVRSSM